MAPQFDPDTYNLLASMLDVVNHETLWDLSDWEGPSDWDSMCSMSLASIEPINETEALLPPVEKPSAHTTTKLKRKRKRKAEGGDSSSPNGGGEGEARRRLKRGRGIHVARSRVAKTRPRNPDGSFAKSTQNWVSFPIP